MSDEDAAALQLHLDAVGDNPSVDDLVANDVIFHRRIAEAAGNPVLTALLDSLTGVTQRGALWRGFAEEERSADARRTSRHRHGHRQPRAGAGSGGGDHPCDRVGDVPSPGATHEIDAHRSECFQPGR